jgi:hypothetical protein
MKAVLAIATCSVLLVTGADAQPAPAAAPKGPAKERCMRLPLSDVAFGIPGATQAAREKLAEYAEAEAKRRKWPAGVPLTQSNETVSCEVYLVFPLIGTEYRCLVTTTFCQK